MAANEKPYPVTKDEEKCRKTFIHRIWSQDAKHWVDVEMLGNGTFYGKQWQGPYKGNQANQTIIKIDGDLRDAPGGGVVVIDPYPQSPSAASVSVPTTEYITFETRGGKVQRQFVNTKENNCRKDFKRRIQFNDIDDEFIEEGLWGRQPPERPKDYQQAVSKTGEGVDLWLDITVPKSFKMKRARQNNEQAIEFKDIWGNGASSLPGALKDTAPDRDHVRLDPYQVVINFGPDGLAVEFHAGSGPPKTAPANPALPPK